MHFLISTDRRLFVTIEVVSFSLKNVDALLEQAIEEEDELLEEDSDDSAIEDLLDAGGTKASILDCRRSSMTVRLASFSSCSVHSGERPRAPSRERRLKNWL